VASGKSYFKESGLTASTAMRAGMYALFQAIFPEWEVPDEWREFIQLNAEMAPNCPSITQQKPPLASG
jgi:hypothetical protein